MEKTEYALECFKNIQDLIKFIDQKSGSILIIVGIEFTAFLEFFKNLEISNLSNLKFFGILTFLSGVSTIFCFLYVLYLSMYKILKPRLANNYKEDEFSLFYFEHLTVLGKEKIHFEYKSLNKEDMLKQIIDQKHEVSEILKQKTKQLETSFNYLFISILSLIFFILSSIQL